MSGEQGETEDSPSEVDPLLIEHAERLWTAECQNADRLSQRSSFLMAALAALLGLGIYRIDWFHGDKDVMRVKDLDKAFWIKFLLAGGLLMHGVAFVSMLLLPIKNYLAWVGRLARKWMNYVERMQHEDISRAKKSSKGSQDPPLPFASHRMNLNLDEFEVEYPTNAESREMIFTRIYWAAIYLQVRNVKRKSQQDFAQQLFVLGFVLIAIAILLYIVYGEPPIIRSA